MRKTFADLGVSFPLFSAPVDEATEYAGPGTCVLCGADAPQTFSLGIGRYIVISCPRCGTPNGLDTIDRTGAACIACSMDIPWPPIPEADLVVCYSCLREGRAALTKDTEFGMVSWEQAVSGITHGIPGGLPRNDFESVALDEGWVGARVPHQHLLELLRTPTFSTIQGEQWLFCCRTPMVYLGSWTREEFVLRSPDGNGEAFFNDVVEEVVPGLWLDQLHDETGVYVFRCSCCQRLRANWDLA